MKNRPSVVFRSLSLVLIIVGLSGCQSMEPTSSPAHDNYNSLNQGYGLLFDLMGDEKNVSKLLIIKREREELNTLIKEIAHACNEAHKQLEKMDKSDPALDMKNRGLPYYEVKSREAIAKTKGKQLLTEKGKDFELHLLLSQNEALTYGYHLAGVLRVGESNPERARFLEELSVQLEKLQGRVVAMLLTNYSWQPDKR